MKKLLLYLILLGGIINATAQPPRLKLWPGQVPDETLPKHPPEEYTANTSGKNIHRISNITDPDLVIYKPGKNANGAAIIICPGGGNKYLAVNLEGEEVAVWLASKGYLALVLDYRVPLKTKGAFQDIQRAVRLVRSKGYEWKLKTDLIGIMGFSAGGNLAARAITGFKSKSYIGQDQIDSISCRPDFSLLIYPGSLVGPDHNLIAELKVTGETPPVFVFVAADDPYHIPFRLGEALGDNKIPFEFHVTPKGGHGYGLRPGNPAAELWPQLAGAWLSRILAAKQ